MEQRLIDANALLDTTEHLANVCFGQGQCYCERTKFQQLIKKQPTVDAVPVVRCSKCKYGITGHGISDGWVLCAKPYATDTVGGAMYRCDWFCADGKEKDEQENQEEKV